MSRWTGMTGVGWTAFVSGALAIAGGAVGQAEARTVTFGHWSVTPGGVGAEIYGVRADLSVSPGSNVGGGDALLSRVSSENGRSLIQTGYQYAPAVVFAPCGARSGLVTYWEWIRPSGQLNCGYVSAPAANTQHRFAAIKNSTTTVWEAYVDGAPRVRVDVQFASASVALAGHELQDAQDGGSWGSGFSGCWACSGGLRFQRKTSQSSGAYADVTTASRYNGWELFTFTGTPGGPAFAISR